MWEEALKVGLIRNREQKYECRCEEENNGMKRGGDDFVANFLLNFLSS